MVGVILAATVAAALGLLTIPLVYPSLGLGGHSSRSRGRRRRPSSSPPLQLPTGEPADGIPGLIGNTPVFRLKSISEYTGCDVLAKAEFLNPGGSSKDRIALYLIERAEKEGLIKPHIGCCIFEGTSGSTGISLAMIARAKGYKCHIVMPDDIAREKSDLLVKLGATVERMPPCSIVDANHFVRVARRRADEYTEANRPENGGNGATGYFVDQFENTWNFEAHFTRTAPEIYHQVPEIDVFVHGSGTGGTLAGVTRFLKPRVPHLKVYLADPQGSGLANKVNYGVMFSSTEKEGTRRRHQVDTIVEGIGLNRLTRNFAYLFPPSPAGECLLDGAVTVTDQDSVYMSRWLMANDGLFVGSSSAINCVAALRVAKRLGPGHTIVTVLADSGQRHITKLWNDDFLRSRSLDSGTPQSLDQFFS
ncbi:Cysteine synthase 2 [Spiromyces aspiralis]|uniref:Cysteine synthase 2 n=1 Tax=Spiromyces aspiralis TaxID=68401 RepID=A0ACC1HE50_9FUNG|nr:Cysteine synthase 2 [Spiromyces aspiralis]